MAIFATAGALHVLTPRPFIAIVPPWLPQRELLVALSGVAELLGAAGLLWPPTRRAAGWGLIALLVAVFPANIQMLLNAQQAHASSWWLAALWLRLPLQAALIRLAYRVGVRSRRPPAAAAR